uniref:Uncharacterized protein n=1 Tax=Oryza rufipogon TaxID=4529 RepID=A0A0E0PXZ0_ORYRU
MKYGGVFAPKFITSGNSAPLVSVDLPRSNFQHTTSSVALALRAANGDSPADLDVQSLNDRSFSFVSHEKDREWTLVPSKKRSVSASMQRPDCSYAQIVISAIPVKSAFQRLQFSLGSKNSSHVSVDRPVSDSKVRIERDNRDPKLLTVGTVCARAIEPIFVMGLFIVGHAGHAARFCTEKSNNTTRINSVDAVRKSRSNGALVWRVKQKPAAKSDETPRILSSADTVLTFVETSPSSSMANLNPNPLRFLCQGHLV